MARPLLFVPAAMLMVFGWTYPHFLERNPWTAYLYAAPMGLLPCPTLATVIGATVMLDFLDSTRWTASVAIAGLVYAAIGVLRLEVSLDYGLLAGAALVLGALADRHRLDRCARPVMSFSGDEPSALGKKPQDVGRISTHP
jgi:hypothetical protein